MSKMPEPYAPGAADEKETGSAQRLIRNSKARHLLSCVLAGLTFLGAGCQSTNALKKAFFIRSEQILGNWEGLSDDGVFYMITLHTNATGKLGYLSHDGNPVVMRIADWRCDDGRLLISLSETNQNPDLVRTLSGRAGWLSMRLDVSGAGWQRPVMVYREADWERLRNAIKPGMDE
jgi:hypothetical protein